MRELRQLKDKDYAQTKEIFDTYLAEIRHENDRLLSLKKQKEQVTKQTQNSKDQNRDANKISSVRQLSSIDKTGEQIIDSYEPSLHAQILRMYDEGFSYEEIAKKLDCGKTEVELIVKFGSL